MKYLISIFCLGANIHCYAVVQQIILFPQTYNLNKMSYS